MGKLGIPVWCYEWMTDFNWLRTNMATPSRGGSVVTSFDLNDVPDSITSNPPISEDELWANLDYFLKRVLPVAEKAGVKLSMHPDDPPLSPIKGVSRIMRSIENYQRLHRHGAERDEHDHALPGQFHPDDRRSARRNPQVRQGRSRSFTSATCAAYPTKFEETWHDAGKTDMLACMQAYRDIGFDGVLRPDHVPTVEGDSNAHAGYSSFGRLYAIGYIRGLREAVYGGQEAVTPSAVSVIIRTLSPERTPTTPGPRSVASVSLPSGPGEVDLDSPPRARSPVTLPLGQALGQRRQQVHAVPARLHQHFEDARGAAEIAVDLERRVGVEHVGVGALRAEQQASRTSWAWSPSRSRAQRLMRQPMPQPVASSPRISSERRAARDQLRGRVVRDLLAGIEAVEVRDVPVVDLRRLHVPVLEPLLELAGLADPVGRQLGAGGAALLAELLVRCRAARRPRRTASKRSRMIWLSIVTPARATRREDAGSRARARAR